MQNSILSAYQFALLMGTLLFLEAISLYGENTFTLLKTSVCFLKRPSPLFRRPLWADNSLLGVLHHLLHRHNARSCCEYLQQIYKHSFKLYQKIWHQIRINAPLSFLCQVRTYTLGALRYDHKILWNAGRWSSHCESVLLTIAVRIVPIRVAVQARGRGGLCQEQQQWGAGRAVY